MKQGWLVAQHSHNILYPFEWSLDSHDPGGIDGTSKPRIVEPPTDAIDN